MAKPWAKAFYNSAAWRDTREAYMVSRHGLCERCGKPGLIVHHRKALRPQMCIRDRVYQASAPERGAPQCRIMSSAE